MSNYNHFSIIVSIDIVVSENSEFLGVAAAPQEGVRDLPAQRGPYLVYEGPVWPRIYYVAIPICSFHQFDPLLVHVVCNTTCSGTRDANVEMLNIIDEYRSL